MNFAETNKLITPEDVRQIVSKMSRIPLQELELPISEPVVYDPFDL